ncbi:MAG: leucine-rich repeat protein [Lachnospiraceae bacterium]|nr:leucine-rich repeat protein [Lachnospiraceae bacterium]
MKEKMLKNRTNKGFGGGFTLSELLVCVAIVAVLTLIAIPVLGKQLESGREEADISNLRSAKSAVTRLLLTAVVTPGKLYFDVSNGSLSDTADDIKAYGQGTETDGGCEDFVIAGASDNTVNTVYTSSSDAKGKIIEVTINEDSFDLSWINAGDNGGADSGTSAPALPVTPYLSVSGEIPSNGFYYKMSEDSGAVETVYGKALIIKAGADFPVPASGDVYEFGEYVYMFNKKRGEMSNGGTPAVNPVITNINDESLNGWSLMTNKRTMVSGYSSEGIINNTASLAVYETPLSSIAGKDVVNADYLFYQNSNLTTAPPLPLSIKSAKNAFCDCTNLRKCEYELPVVSDKMFRNCPLLEGVLLTERITSIGQNAFYGCTSIESIYIPDSVTTIKAFPFGSCSVDIVLNMGHSGVQSGFNSKWNKLDGKNTATSVINNINWNYGK